MKMKIWLPVLMLVAVMAGGAYWYFFLQTPPSLTGLSSAPAPRVEALNWEELRTGLAPMEALEIRQHGVRFFQKGDPDKSFLLFKTAAKKGDGWSALVVGEMYDPATFAAENFDSTMTAFSKPNPAKALQWYQRALELGEEQAQQRYDDLIAYLRRAAGSDPQARRILRNLK